MILRRSILLTLSLSSLCLSSHASETLVSDNFDFRGSTVAGDPLFGRTTQDGKTLYDYPSKLPFQFSEINGEEVASPAPKTRNSATSFSIPNMPETGTIQIEAIVNLNQTKFDGIAGAWIGLTESDSMGLLYGTSAMHAALRLLPITKDAGRIQLRTKSKAKINSSLSSGSLEILNDRDYLLKLAYNIETQVVTASVTDTVTQQSISTTKTLSTVADLNKAQFDFTALKARTPLEAMPYFKEIAVVHNQ